MRLGCRSPSDLPIVGHLQRETQAALKQGHIFTGYFGLICKSIDEEQECVSCLVPLLPSEGRLSGLKDLKCHVWGDNRAHLQEGNRVRREINRLLMEQALHKGATVQNTRCFNGTCHKPIRLTWYSFFGVQLMQLDKSLWICRLEEAMTAIGNITMSCLERPVAAWRSVQPVQQLIFLRRAWSATVSQRVVTEREAGNIFIPLTWQRVYVAVCVCWGLYKSPLLCVCVSTSVNLGSALPGAARHIYHSRRESANFSSLFTVTPVFTGCTPVRLVFSAVPPQPSVPSPAIGGRGSGRGCRAQSAGRWLGSHLISARALGLWEMTTTGHTCPLGPVRLTAIWPPQRPLLVSDRQLLCFCSVI